MSEHIYTDIMPNSLLDNHYRSRSLETIKGVLIRSLKRGNIIFKDFTFIYVKPSKADRVQLIKFGVIHD